METTVSFDTGIYSMNWHLFHDFMILLNAVPTDTTRHHFLY